MPKIKRIYGVDSSFLPTPVDVPDVVQKAGVPTVGWLARWDPVKRPEIFLQLVRRFPEVRFRFAGSALDKNWVRHLKETYGSAPNLDWVGRIDQFRDPEAHAAFLDEAWIMVNASTKEAMPNAFIEAAAHECAILSGLDPDGFASRFGYHARRAGDNNYPTPDDFAAGLRWLLEEDRWRSRGRLAREHVKANFETDVAMGLHIEMYRDHLHGRAADSSSR